MKRQFSQLNGTFDLVVVGGGITGAFTAWEASRRGLKVALLEKNDFGGGTSANSLKVIHGGFRRIKKGDLWGMWQGMVNRSEYLKLAPHLVRPLPVVVPLYGNKWLQSLCGWGATFLYNLFSKDLINGASNSFVNKETVLRLVPGLPRQSLAGGVLFHDAQAFHTERLTWGVVQSFIEAGGVAVNYAHVQEPLKEINQIKELVVQDVLNEDHMKVFTKSVVWAMGPWTVQQGSKRVSFARALNLVVHRRWSSHAFGLSGPSGRFYFFAPWNGMTLVGTHQKWDGPFNEDKRGVEELAEEFRVELNENYPAFQINKEDIVSVHAGWVPAQGPEKEKGNAELSEKPLLLDHASSGGIQGCLTLIGVKYTGAPRVARQAVDWVNRFLKRGHPAFPAHFSGGMENLLTLKSSAGKSFPRIPVAFMDRIIGLYGSHYKKIIELGAQWPDGLVPIDSNTQTTPAEVLYAVREEMAVQLSDVIFRRTMLGSQGIPSEKVLKKVVQLMAQEVGWSDEEQSAQIKKVRGVQPPAQAVA
ncbi:MAG: Aerobic glycerol-3-phosphate dehydrogenase [Elusimicrobia bacterium]|nr:Aerobic glycerol-3-phosphate dehydrogenase [Elusimicrobiota bacterium]